MTITIESLSKTYKGGVRALSDVSLEITPGMFGLLGPNGAGKSTLMRILATLQEADTGSVRLGDVDVLRQKTAVRRQLGYLPQEFGLYPKIPAGELLDHLAVLKGVTNKKERTELVQSLLEKTNLSEFRRRKLGTFSGGMRQRFGIAAALLGNPKLIIVDEPTAGLDPEERVRFHNLLSDLGGKDIVVLLSTHIVADVSDICPNMAVLDHGQVVRSGATASLVKNLEGRVFKKTVPIEDAEKPILGMQVLSVKRLDDQAIIRCSGDPKDHPDLEPAPPTLEDVYFVSIKGDAREEENKQGAR